ncbi:cytochrome C oxidase subunit IV family protein [Paenibacillus gansuensis]|uniref:Cytochrome C oxidase subunit IV family protein n=1 Tax=Paenibacillus gansuensis TaxID=306542 RepID=A0ABW5PHZ1_9BACL
MAQPHGTAEQGGRRRRHEGPQKHLIAFVFSLILTLIAFAAVAAGEMNRNFVLVLLVVMAIGQVLIQLIFWMHMKDRGHLYPIIGLAAGAFVAFTCVIMALYWVWW